MISVATVTIVDAVTRNNYCVKISDERIKTIEEFYRHMTASKGHNCNVEFCKGNDCVCSSEEQSLCEDIECDDQKEGICMTQEECDKYILESKSYTCTDEVCKDNDCVCSSEEQPLCEDIGSEDLKEGKCMTKVECNKYMNVSKGCTCTDDSVLLTTTTDPIHEVKLSSNEFRICLRDSNIEPSPSIKSLCKNMIYTHKHSVQVVERADIYCTEMTSPLSITSKTKYHDEPFTLPINSQKDLSRSIQPKSEKKEQQSQSFVNIKSSSTTNTSDKDES